MIQHYLKCEAPICADTRGYDSPTWKKEVLWYPDEKICQKGPYTKWQKRQVRLQKLLKAGKLKNPYTCYTAEMLEKIQYVRQGTKGRNPNAYTDRRN